MPGALLSVRGDDRLKAAALAVAAANRDLRRRIDAATRETIGPVWTVEVNARTRTTLDRAVYGKGARIKAGNPPVAQAATSTKKLRGGLVPADQWRAVEFGANRAKVTTYDRVSVKGKTHSVTRHTARQLPPPTRAGRVAYPAFAEAAPRAVALWVQLVVRVYNDAVNGERSLPVARGVNLSFLADVRPFLKGTDDIQDALEDVGGSLDDLTRDAQQASREQATALDGIADAGNRAAQDLTDDFRAMARQADTSFDAVRTSGDQAMTDLGTNSKGKASAAGAEVGSEFAANIGEQIGSGQANIADILAGTLGGLVTIPGIGAAAAGIGIGALLVKGLVDGAAKSKAALQEAIQTVFDSITVDASNLSIEWNRQKMLDDAIDNLTEGGRAADLQKIADWVKQGIGEDTIAKALVGEIDPAQVAALHAFIDNQAKIAADQGRLQTEAGTSAQEVLDLLNKQNEASRTANDLARTQRDIYAEAKTNQEGINAAIGARPSEGALARQRYRWEKP